MNRAGKATGSDEQVSSKKRRWKIVSTPLFRCWKVDLSGAKGASQLLFAVVVDDRIDIIISLKYGFGGWEDLFLPTNDEGERAFAWEIDLVQLFAHDGRDIRNLHLDNFQTGFLQGHEENEMRSG